MNSLSQINPGGMGYHGGYGAMSSSAAGVNSYESLNAGLTIQTREGDVVTLSAGRFSELDAHEYTSRGEFSGRKGSVSAAYNEREITLSSGEQFTFTVKGELSEAELKDIESIVSGVDEIIGEMADGDMEDAVSKALSMGSYDSISRYEAEITLERSQEVYAEERSAAYGRGRNYGHGHRGGRMHGSMPAPEQEVISTTTDDQSNAFMNRVAGFLEQQNQEAVAWARQPLGQLFSHHLEALTAPEAADDSADEIDTGAELDETVLEAAVEAAGAADDADDADDVQEIFKPEDSPLYQMLEDAAQRVDELINTMMKDLFGNTLDRMA